MRCAKRHSICQREQVDSLVSYREISEDDMEFLYQVYASTREPEMNMTNWPDVQKESFLRMQFAAQHKHYQEQFQHASFQVILQDGRPIGRLYVDRRTDEHRIVDIALMPAFRGQGIGGQILNELLSEAAKLDKPVRIHVELNNPALRLYQRLGFCEIGDAGLYLLMEWKPRR